MRKMQKNKILYFFFNFSYFLILLLWKFTRCIRCKARCKSSTFEHTKLGNLLGKEERCAPNLILDIMKHKLNIIPYHGKKTKELLRAWLSNRRALFMSEM